MKIGYVLPMTWACGGVLVPLHQANGLVLRGHDVTVHVPEEPHIPWFPLRAAIASLADAEGDPPFDIRVYVGNSFLRYSSGQGQKFLLVQGMDHLLAAGATRKQLLEGYANPEHHILAVSDWVAAYVRDRCGNRSVSVVSNGIDPEQFHPDASRRGQVRILVEGNFPDANKNVIHALEAAHRIRQFEKVEVWALGRRFASPGALVDRVFVDPPRNEIPAIYRQCDALLKTTILEGFGLPQLEAMACGCVPITYASGGVHDFCRNGENSLVTGVGNLPGLVRHLLRFVADADLRARLRERAIETARRHTWDSVVDRLESIFMHAPERSA